MNEHATVEVSGRLVLVDHRDLSLLRDNGCWIVVPGAVGHRTYPYVRILIDGERKSLHRLIAQPGPGQHTDHINGNTLDNRRENLRCVTPQQNCLNRRGDKYATSRFKGVYWHKVGRKWSTEITANGEKHYLGLFESEFEAARAYNAKAREVHGEFARLNEVPESPD